MKSWIQVLYETYENCQSMIDASTEEDNIPLLPICHTTQKAQIEIVLDENGKFKRARIVPKNEARTIIPSTEKSAGRTSGEAPHPLCDKLQYIAADYPKFGGEKDHYYNSYITLLGKWVEYGAPRKVRLIYEYARQGTLISDLVKYGILFVDNNNKLIFQRSGKKETNGRLDIFDLLPGKIDPSSGKFTNWQAEAFVRWRVEIPGDPRSAVWEDQEIIQSWIDFYSSTRERKALCYVTGKESFAADQHPAKLRNDGDKAKLISSNDLQGYTFRGRFTNADQAATVGFSTTQKAHSALRWLIGRQGYNRYGLAIVAWATSGKLVPQPTDNASTLLWGDIPSEIVTTAYTAQELAIKLRNRIAGYGKELANTDEVIVMALDSAVPGRMAITYYRDLTGSDFLQKIENWHSSCSWLHTYLYMQEKDGNGKEKKRFVPFVGAPAPDDIAEAVYAVNRNGKFELDEKLRKLTIMRLLPCIVDDQPIPRDLVESVVRRASNRIGLEDWQWEKTLSIACSLFKKSRQGKEEYGMSLDENRRARDYLYGRLLAVADVLEERALSQGEKKRATNAARYMQLFSQHPFSTWKQIHDLLTPYILRLGGATYYKNLIAEVMELFDPDDFISNAPLSGEYLLGYYCQRMKLKTFERKDRQPQEADEADSENLDE